MPIGIIGQKGSLLLVSGESDISAIIDTEFGIVVEKGSRTELYSKHRWLPNATLSIPQHLEPVVAAALSNPKEFASGPSRLYTIPKGAQAEAKKALEWRKEHKRGGTPVGMNTARTLAKGGQIGIEKVRHIAKYFPRHEVDKKGKGWAPGEDNFPSNGRIAWALWGGDAAWKWAQAIVEREDKKAKTAGGYSPHGAEIVDFMVSKDLGVINGPEFIARVRMDGSGLDRLYKVDLDHSVYVWDSGSWENLGSVDGDIWTYDRALDEPYDIVEKTHISIDPESAIKIAARLDAQPFNPVSVFDIDKDEAVFMRGALPYIDYEFLDTIVSAGPQQPKSPSYSSGDGVYTPEERSQSAAKQARDAFGKFIPTNGRVYVGGDPSAAGKLLHSNQDGTASIQLENGRKINIDPKLLHNQPSAGQVAPPKDLSKIRDENKPLDLSGVLAQPRTPIDRPVQLPETMPRLTSDDLHDILYNWDSWVETTRNSYKSGRSKPTPTADSDSEHALLRQQAARKKFGKRLKKPEDDWTRGVNAAATPPKGTPLTPETSDVEPLYLAIVAEDDPQAVLDLIAIAPQTNKTTAPMTYRRVGGEWQKAPEILAELRSATPPPVVALKPSVLQDVLVQVDGLLSSLLPRPKDDLGFMVLFGPNPGIFALAAAGGLDRNRGNAERLRRYWTRGEGALKIRWGTPGDWKRCVRHLSKYMGPRARGYCQLRHKEATGVYTGSRLNPGNRRNRGNFSSNSLWALESMSPTKISKKDLSMSLEEIDSENDPLFASSWQPSSIIAAGLEQLSGLSDEEFSHVMGGPNNTNPYNEEHVYRYWVSGPGATKIGWDKDGSWTRCVQNLSKYMGKRAESFCAIATKDATNVWVGDFENKELMSRSLNKGFAAFSTDNLNTSWEIFAASNTRASVSESKEKIQGLIASGSLDTFGARFRIPLVIPEDVESGDGRKFKKKSISIRELPLPLLWQVKTDDGHTGSVVVGRIDHMERTDEGIGNAYGYFDTGAYGKEAERLVRNKFIRGVSADMDQFEAEDLNDSASEKEGIKKDKILINKARVMAVTIVPKPAFQECSIFIDENNQPNKTKEDAVATDGVYVEDVDPLDAAALVACGYVSQSIPVTPPSSWFENPGLSGLTPLTVSEDGKIYGHIAGWETDHIGLPFGTKPPRSRSNYAYFQTGVLRTEDGMDIPVGQLTLAGGHASLEASAAEAVRHYDDTASAFADVRVGEDAYGIWVSGALRPGTTPEQIRAIRASAPSGDWRPIRGSLELVAVCQVNVPGFPVARARVASGAVMALVAAGASTLAKMQYDPLRELSSRISALESGNIASPEDADFAAKIAELSARVELSVQYLDNFADISRQERKKLAEKGQALPDGSYPIRNVQDLKNAIQAFGRAKKAKRSDVRKHIIKQAKRLRRQDLIPENWRAEYSAELSSKVDDMRKKAMIAAAKTLENEEESPKKVDAPLADSADAEPEGRATSGKKDISTGKYIPGKTQPRDDSGKFRKVLARLKQDLGTAGLQNIVEEAKYVEGLHEIGNYSKAAEAASDLLNRVERLDTGALNKVSLENVRASTAELGRVIANLPLGAGDQTQKLRYSDLPPALQNLMDDMIERVEAKIGSEDADIATQGLKSFISGSDVYNQAEIASEMNKLLRLLT